jgi:hypothetical protein
MIGHLRDLDPDQRRELLAQERADLQTTTRPLLNWRKRVHVALPFSVA